MDRGRTQPVFNAPPPPRSSRHQSSAPPPQRSPRNHSPPSTSPTRNRDMPPTPPFHLRREAPPRSTNPGNSDSRNVDVNRVGHTKRDSLGILNLSFAATEREMKVHYRRLARIYHPDKYDPTTNEMSKFEAQEHFKLLINAYEYLHTN